MDRDAVTIRGGGGLGQVATCWSPRLCSPWAWWPGDEVERAEMIITARSTDRHRRSVPSGPAVTCRRVLSALAAGVRAHVAIRDAGTLEERLAALEHHIRTRGEGSPDDRMEALN
jgi:hypothetical protein